METTHRRPGSAASRRLLVLAFALPLLAIAAPHARAADLAALPPRAGADAVLLARGAAEWVRGRFEESGLASEAGFALAAELPVQRTRLLPDFEVLRTRVASHGAERAWVLEFEVQRGQARVRVALLDLASGAAVATGHADAPVAASGTAVATAVDSLVAGLGLAPVAAPAPALTELAALGRAAESFDAGHLADAHRALAGTSSRGAAMLRARVEAAGEAPATAASERARLDVARGDSERARLRLRAELGAHPDDPGLLLAAGEAAADLGEPARAIPFFDRVLELDADAKAARDGRALALVQLGRAVEAVPLLADAEPAAIELALRTPDLDAATGGALHLMLARARALRFDVDRAQEQLDRAAEADPALVAQAQRASALLHAGVGSFDRALAPAEQAAAAPDADAPVWQALGAARLAAGDASGARTAFDRAHRLAPEDPEPLRGIAAAAQQAGDTAAATASLQQAVALAPADAGTRRMLAGLLRVSGQVDQALALLEGQPGDPQPELLREVASIRSEGGDAAGAAVLLEQAMQLAPADPAVARDLAALREQGGDAAGAATLRRLTGSAVATAEPGAAASETSATLSGFEELAASFPSHLPGRSEPLHAVALLAPSRASAPGLVERVLAPKRLSVEAVGDAIAQALGAHFEVVSPREIPGELAAADQSVLRAFAEDEASVARMNQALGTDAVFFARVDVVETAAGAKGVQIELRMGVGGDPLDVQRFANQTWIEDGTARFGEWNPTALIALSLALLAALLPLLRGWGQLQVGLQYASLGKGFFSIRITRRSIKADLGATRGKAERRYLKKMRMMGRYERAMVGKETLFRWLPARRYYVTVHGLLQDRGSDAVIGSYAAEQTVVIERGKTARLDFDFRAQEATIELSIFDGETTAPLKVRVALRGVPDSLRYAHGGSSIFYVAPGVHRVLVGAGGRVLERQIRIDECAARTLAFDLQDESCRIFDGCPEAVEPYLIGNLEAAADALERAGLATAAANVRGEYYAAIGETEKAARAFQSAGRFEEAAGLLSGDVDPGAAAELYERAGNHEKAATAWEEAGDVLRAARQYETAYRYDDALDCYRRAGLVEKVCELLEKLARHYEAAGTALELGDADRAIRDLQMIDLRDPDYGRACQMLGQIFADRGEHELAVQKLAEAVEVGGGETAPLEAVEQLARAQERAGLCEAAMQTWEAIRARDFHYPDASTRIEALRSSAESARATRATLARVSAAPGGAEEESRYEILGELGRGGMGVVFKARDKRLGRVVALKRLPDNLRNHPTAVRLFLREARAAAALNHRNIVTLFDAGQEGDQYFLTMELLEGLPLHDLLVRRGKLSARDAARLGAQACAGLDYAHGQGVVHRDIKTSNLFFTQERVVKIMDFGLAKMTEEVRRAATVVGGTPYYMAPEQAAGDDVDPRADQYALGVTLFELVTGDVPFKTGDVTYHHRHSAPPDPRASAPDLPEALVTLILRLMAKRPDERFARASEAGAELQRIARQLAD